MCIVRLDNVRKDYRLGNITLSALKGINLIVEAGEFLAIAGPSGSGKTTALNLIGCIDKPTAGQVLIDSVETSGLSADERADIRAHKLSFIFQNFNLLPVLTALENVEYPLLNRSLTAAQKRSLAEAALESVGLATFAGHRPLELSGGQQQRVAIARAIVASPLLILADEPTANLDRATGEEILNLMKKINTEKKTTFIFSTHDQKIIDKANRVIWLSDGAIA
jgi:putative ABC transport system ATP-binding protein